MSVAYQSSNSTHTGASAVSVLTIASVALTGDNRFLFLGKGLTSTPANTFTPSRTGSTFSSLGIQHNIAASKRVLGQVWASTNEPQTTAADLVMTNNSGSQDFWGFGYVSLTGVDQTTRHDTVVLNPVDDGGSNIADVISSETGDMVVDFITARTVNDVLLAEGDNTKRTGWSSGTTSTDTDGAFSTAPGAATVTMDWTASVGIDIMVHYSLNVNAVALTVPGAPTSLTATAASGSQINLSWTAPASDGGSAILGYEIQRESPIAGGFSTIVSDTGTTSTTYSDTGLAAGTQYNYRVRALNAIGGSTPSNEDDATTNAATAPDPPTSLLATKESPTTMLLSWVAPVDDGDSDIIGYKIERETGIGGGFSTIVADTGNTDTTYRDTGLTKTTEYNWKVSAINAIGTGTASTADAETTPDEADNAQLSLLGYLSWMNPSIPRATGGVLDQADRQHLLSLGESPLVTQIGRVTIAQQEQWQTVGI